MQKVKYLILGAGPCGIGAAYFFHEQGENDFLILEKESVAGGLARTLTDDKGFLWDIGGHVQFSHYKKFDEAMNKALPPKEWVHHERNSAIWIKDRFIPYPFQDHLHELPEKDQKWCLETLEKYRDRDLPENFESWIFQTFGEGIANLFMIPYNFKVWAYPPSMLTSHWIEDRVSAPSFEEIKRQTEAPQNKSWGPNRTFQFPLKGGTGAIWKSLAQQVAEKHTRYNIRAEHLDPKEKVLTTSTGETFQYQYLLTTIPLNLFVQNILKSNSPISVKTQEFLYSSTHVVGLGLKGKPLSHVADKTWMYFPESNSPFYRVTVFSNYSPHNVPGEGFSSLMTETSESPYKPVSEEQICDEVIEGSLNSKLIDSRKDIVSVFHFKAPLGYPTPFLKRDQLLQNIILALEEQDIYSRGRFGGWKYEVSNQDHTFMQGYEWGQRLIQNAEETTYRP